MAIEHLALGGLEQPAAKAVFTVVLEAVQVLENVAADRLREVGSRLLVEQPAAGTQPQVGADARQIALDQGVDRERVAAGGLGNEIRDATSLRFLRHRATVSRRGQVPRIRGAGV